MADVRAGTFIAAIGADNPEKSEIDPALDGASARVVTDLTEQCSYMGDLHHALRAGTMQAADVHAELGELVAGRKPGRTAAHEITLFDGSGVGLQDVAASACAYEFAKKRNAGSTAQPRVRPGIEPFGGTSNRSKEKRHEMDHARAREGRSGRLPVADQEVRR